LPRPFAAPLIAGPADDVTFDRPSEAFDWKLEAVCDAFEEVSFAASAALAVVDSNLRATRPGSFVDCRKAAREMANDMIILMRTRRLKEKDRDMRERVVGEQLVVAFKIVRDSTFFAGHREDLEEPR
jgi:hypothetical protein